MTFLLCCLAMVGLGWWDQPDSDRRASGPVVTVRLGPGPYVVGQAIGLDVLLTRPAGGERAEVVPPSIPQAELMAIAADSGVARRYFLVARRAGPLAIPPFRVRIGDRQVATKPTTITVASVPTEGRTPAFLAGVGPFRLTSRVAPGVVRVGQPVEFRITMTGLAAVGSNLIPDLAGWSGLPAAFEVRTSRTELEAGDPPTRTFHYRLRPTKPGRAVLPPVPLAAYNPASRGFTTQYTPSLALEVEPPPRFDPAVVAYGPVRPTPSRGGGVDPITVAWSVAGAGLIGGGWWARRGWVRSRRASRPVVWRREAARLARLGRTGADRRRVAEVVTNRLAGGIAEMLGQPMAVLTPAEAEATIRALTSHVELSRRAERLIVLCDQIRFDRDANATAGDRGELVAEAVAVFEAIGRQARGQPRQVPTEAQSERQIEA